MNLLHYVTEYLGTHPEVIVPGMGRFCVVQREAQVQQQKGKIVPPTTEVAFYEDRQAPGDAFLTYVQQQSGKPLTEVQPWVQSQIDTLYQDVQQQKIFYSPIGIFTPAENGGVQLKEAFTQDRQHEFYGLEPITVYPTADQSDRHRPQVPIQHKKKSSSWLWWLFLVILPLLGLAAAAWYYQEDFFGKKSFESGLAVPPKESNSTATTPALPALDSIAVDSTQVRVPADSTGMNGTNPTSIPQPTAP